MTNWLAVLLWPNRVHSRCCLSGSFPLLSTPPRGDAVTSSSHPEHGSRWPGSLTPEDRDASQRTGPHSPSAVRIRLERGSPNPQHSAPLLRFILPSDEPHQDRKSSPRASFIHQHVSFRPHRAVRHSHPSRRRHRLLQRRLSRPPARLLRVPRP